ncbi:MarR family protein [compost metagenome]
MGYYTALYQSKLPHRAVSVYMYLRDRANADGTCYPAIGTIARELKLSRSTVKRAIADLTRSGYLCKEHRLFFTEMTKGEVCPFAGPWYGSSWTR